LLLAAVAALRAGRPEAALDALVLLFADPAFEAATDLDDAKARAASLRAQALLQLGRPAEAWTWNEQALRLARALGDEAGLAELRAQHEEIRSALTVVAQQNAAAEHNRRLAGLSVDQILLGLGSGAERADALAKKANAEVDVGRAAEAAVIARRAIEEAVMASVVREEVFARIALARAAPDEAPAQLLAAWRRAERESEFNLVTAVAGACEVLGVRLPSLVGPET
jgi:hypothetical protein